MNGTLNEILQNLPHVFPFRLIDRILEIEPGKKAIALKNVSEDDLFLQGHFSKGTHDARRSDCRGPCPDRRLGLSFKRRKGTGDEDVPFLAAIDQFRLKRKVIPGDQIILEAEVLHVFSHLAKVKVRASVGDETVAEGMFVLAKGPSPQTLA